MSTPSQKNISQHGGIANTENAAGSKKYEETTFVDTSKPVWNYSLLTNEDVVNYQNGTNYQLYKKFGSHAVPINGEWGMYFCVWAPNATSVSVKGRKRGADGKSWRLVLLRCQPTCIRA